MILNYKDFLNENYSIRDVLLNNNGKPLVLYHGSDNKFDEFDFNHKNINSPDHTFGMFFTDNYLSAISYGEYVKRVNLIILNPLTIDFDGNSTVLIDKWLTPSQLTVKIKEYIDDINNQYQLDDDDIEFLEEHGVDLNIGNIDGIIMLNVSDNFSGDKTANNYVVFDNSQIKKA